MKRLHSAVILLACLATSARAGEPLTIPAAELDELLAAYALVKSQYVESVDDRKLLGGAIDGMLASLDPHSRYLDKKELDELQQSHDGKYVGVGVEVEVDAGQMHVVAVTEDAAADRAGIAPGDTIMSIDGAPVTGMRAPETTRRMRGLPNSTVTVGYQHAGSGTVRIARMMRTALQAKTVRMREPVRGIAWLRVSEFEGKTAGELAAALKLLDARGAPRGIVLDLRNDPGGLISAAVGVASAFLPPDTKLFSTRGQMAGAEATVTVNPRYYRGKDEPDVLADLPGWVRSVPLTVLVNGASASSAELVAGALQDNGRAKVIGTRTFGKGSIQTVFPLTADSAVKITVARYFTPNGKEIQAQGIKPDVVVAPRQGRSGSEGLALREEDLTHHLEATLPTDKAPSPDKRTAVESTRMFGTDDDAALATAVALLAPGQGEIGRPGSVLRQLGVRLQQFGATKISL
jgi:carboxyl-terminal processing protease